MIFYLIIAVLITIVTVTLLMAVNKKKKYEKYTSSDLCFLPLIVGAAWPLSIIFCILYVIYEKFLKEIHEKIVVWISERL